MLRTFLTTALILLVVVVSGFDAPESVTTTEVKDGAVVALEKSWTLYHSVSSPSSAGNSAPSLERRGRVLLTVTSGSDATIAVENDPHAPKSADFNASSGWYRLTLVPDDDDDDDKELHKDGVATTVPFCQLRRANFRDEIVLMFGENGRVLSLSYQPLVSPLAPTSCAALEPLESPPEFQSRISYETSTPGLPLRHVLTGEKPPPGLKFLPYPKRPQQQAAGSPSNPLLQDGGDGPNQKQQPDSPFSFMRRYWYILLPIMLLNIMGGSSAPEQPDQNAVPPPPQQGPSQGPALLAPATAAATSPGTRGSAAAASSPSAASGTAKQRRGKRG